MPQLSGQDAISKGFVKDHVPSFVRPASYDLTIDHVMINGEVHTSDIDINPQQVVILVSKETIEIPDKHVAYAFPKTTLCNRGVHVLNTGIIDPGFKGRISTLALNFDGEKVKLKRGDSFLRITFHELNSKEKDTRLPIMNDAARLEDARRLSRQFPESFLNLNKTQEAVANKIFGRAWINAGVAIGVLSIFFAIVFGLLTWFAPELGEVSPVYKEYKNNVASYQGEVTAMDERLKAIESKLDALSKEQSANRKPTDHK